MATFFAWLYALLNAIPPLRAWYVEFVTYCTNREKSALADELLAARVKMFKTGNQIDLEKGIGSTNAGKPAQNRDSVDESPNT